MRILIDTQIFLWLFGQSNRISSNVRNLLTSPNNTIYFSAVSSWEIAIKYGNGKLKLPDSPEIFIPNRLKRANFFWLEITHEHTLAVAHLPLIHKDPFDRLLIAQANIENLTLLSTDGVFSSYSVKLIDANKH
ncbi:MAG: type II toxin-antitoxin system VapC family toxin [Pyrinomonadaceae bacterium]|nr:type II toxin-antitoxin system VapC family toxin [Pyrinomonadaceae bacterium]